VIELPLFIAAFFAGVFMFLAPCTLPIVPGYLAFISGVSLGKPLDEAARRRLRRMVLRNAFAFVIGFSLIFIALGASAGVLGAALGEWRFALARLGGIIIILFGITMLGLVRIPGLSGDFRLPMPRFLQLGRAESSFLIGALFALGWSPCIGPILGTILLFASTSATALEGALLLGTFSLGLGLPFLLTAVLIHEANTYLQRIGGFARALSLAGGLLLIALGALMLAGRMDLLITWGFGALDFLHYDALLQYL
jgi:cytochrome c-type biogenesis protein